MTIKEVARDLGVSELFVRNLIEDGLIDYYVIQHRIPVNQILNKLRRDPPEKSGILDITVFGIDPEEVEYIDWYIHYGKKENRGIRTIVKNNKDFQKQNEKKKRTINVYY